MSLAWFLQNLVNGLSIGSVYAVFALGYTLVFSVLGIINFAHGAVFTLGAYLTYVLAVGEFGRSPQRGVSTSGNQNSDDGRDREFTDQRRQVGLGGFGGELVLGLVAPRGLDCRPAHLHPRLDARAARGGGVRERDQRRR